MCKVLKQARLKDLDDLIYKNWEAQKSIEDAIQNSHGLAKKVLENEVVKLVIEEHKLIAEYRNLAHELGLDDY